MLSSLPLVDTLDQQLCIPEAYRLPSQEVPVWAFDNDYYDIWQCCEICHPETWRGLQKFDKACNKVEWDTCLQLALEISIHWADTKPLIRANCAQFCLKHQQTLRCTILSVSLLVSPCGSIFLSFKKKRSCVCSSSASHITWMKQFLRGQNSWLTWHIS